MDKASRNKPLKIKEKRRNKRISSKRAPGERPFAVIKTIFKSAHILVTTVPRVKIKNMMSCFSQPKTTKHNPKKQYQCSDSYLKFR
jgi:IS5 family transposase